jgi:hypothetical protein
MSNNKLKDFKINIKIKLSALWAGLTLCYFYCDYFELYVPEKIEGLISGNNQLDSPLKLFAASLMLAIPATMVFLSVLLPPIINRLLNIIFGIFFTLVMAIIAFTIMGKAWYTFYLFFAIVEILIASVIVWYALHWPRMIER